MLRAYKYRLYPTKEQETLFSKTFGCIRYIWNYNVAIFNSWNKETNPNPIYKNTTQLRNELEWMKEVSYTAVQQKERDFIKYKTQYFSKKRKTKIKRCKFKNKFDNQSYRLTNKKYELNEHTIRLEKIGNVKIVIDRRPNKDCKFMSVTISKDKQNKYYASVLVEENIKPRFESTNKSIGIDLGLKEFLILSNGDKIENPRWFRENQTKLKIAQQNLSRKKKGSNRYNKCKLKVARIHDKIKNQRNWFHHQVSLDLVKRFDFIGMENLNISGMLKNRKLSKSITDASWGQFTTYLKYKSNWNKRIIQEIDRYFPSSKTCFECGVINQDLKLGDRMWVCKSCGCEHDRDINASCNIEKEALRVFNITQGVACV